MIALVWGKVFFTVVTGGTVMQQHYSTHAFCFIPTAARSRLDMLCHVINAVPLKNNNLIWLGLAFIVNFYEWGAATTAAEDIFIH